jgi:DNA-binding transcriptional LysR family regulator
MIDVPSPLPPQVQQLRVKHLILLQQIAVYGSLRRVAEHLHVTQPAITAMLKDLESAFGADLVQRDRRGAVLTERGHATRRRLESVINELQAFRLADALSSSGRLLRVGVLPVAMIGLASAAIAALQPADAGLTVRLVEQTVETALNGLYTHKLDCAISRIDAGTLAEYPRDAFRLDPLLQVEMKVACGVGHPLLRCANVTLELLSAFPWAVLALDSQARLAFEHAFVLSGLTPPVPVIESFSFVSNLHLVQNTDLLTIAPASAIAEFRRLGIVEQVAFTWPVPVSPLMLITRRQAVESADLEQFREVLRTCARRIEDT